MQLRNTPNSDFNVSPAQIVFGTPIRDAFAFSNRLKKFSNQNVQPLWHETWLRKKEALQMRFYHLAELIKLSRRFSSLLPGDRCYIHNQAGHYPSRWDHSGTVVEDHGHDSYTVKVDKSDRVTRCNRKHLRQFSRFTGYRQSQTCRCNADCYSSAFDTTGTTGSSRTCTGIVATYNYFEPFHRHSII